MQVWNVLHAARWKCRTQKSRQNRHVGTIAQICRAMSSQLRQSEKIIKQQYFLHMFPQYGELRSTSGWDRLTGLGHPSKFQRLSRLGFVTAAASLNGSQPSFARCLAVLWAGWLFIHFRRLLPLTEFCQVLNSLCVLQILRSPILSALLHGTRAVGASQTLRRWAQGTTYIQQGTGHVGHWPTL